MSSKATYFTYIPGRSSDLDKVHASPPAANTPTRAPSLQDSRPNVAAARGATGGVTSRTPPSTVTSQMVRRRRSRSKDSGMMTSLRWTDDRFDVGGLVKTYQGQFPVIAQVTRGYSSGSDEGFQLNIGQIVQIYGVRDQTRIKATDCEGQILSVPYDCEMTVKAKTTSGPGAVKRLCEFVDDSVLLPVTVDVVHCGRLTESLSRLVGTQLTIDSVYQSKFLFASAIHNGWLDSAEIMAIHDDLCAELCVAKGLLGANTDEWIDYCGMFARTARHLRLDDVTGYKGVYYMSWSKNSRPAVTPKVDGTAVAAVDSDQRLNVQPYILRSSVAACRQRPPSAHNSFCLHHSRHQQPQPLWPSHHPIVSPLASRQRSSVAFQSLDSLDLVGSSIGRTSPPASFCRDSLVVSSCCQPKLSSRRQPDAAAGDLQLSMLPLKDLSRQCLSSSSSSSSSVKTESRRSRSSKLAETALNEPAAANEAIGKLRQIDSGSNLATGSNRHIAVQVSLPALEQPVAAAALLSRDQLVSSFPLARTNCPRMGKRCALPVGPRKLSCTGDVTDGTDTALGGSMPCLLTDSVEAGTQLSALSASSADVEARTTRVSEAGGGRWRVRFQVGTAETSTSSEVELAVDDGYCTKDSSTSMSSSGEQSLARASNGRRDVSPVFF